MLIVAITIINYPLLIGLEETTNDGVGNMLRKNEVGVETDNSGGIFALVAVRRKG